MDWAAYAGRGFKARTMIIGDGGVQHTMSYDSLVVSSDVLKLRPLIKDLTSWLHSRLNVSFPVSPPLVPAVGNNTTNVQHRPIAVTFVMRPKGHKRRVMNMAEIVSHFKTWSNMTVRAQILEELSLAQQVIASNIGHHWNSINFNQSSRLLPSGSLSEILP